MPPWWPFLVLLSWYSIIKSSHWNPSKERVPMNLSTSSWSLYELQCTGTVLPGTATGWHAHFFELSCLLVVFAVTYKLGLRFASSQWKHKGLKHWGRDKMAAILADDIFKFIFRTENSHILNKLSLKFVPKGPFDNNPSLVHIMAWGWTGAKSLSELMTV